MFLIGYKNFEIIFINDNSTDDSIEVLNTFLQKTNQHITHTVISHPSNKGLGAARNTGINVAQGDFLFFLDSDDVLAYDALENLIKAQNLYDADVVIGSVGLIDESGQKIKEYTIYKIRVKKNMWKTLPFMKSIWKNA